MNKRDALLNLLHDPAPPAYVPAAFFLHFDPAFHQGQAAVEKHLEFYRLTGMDFVKVQFEQAPSHSPTIRRAKDWADAPLYPAEYFETPAAVARGLVEAAGREALVIMTLYSPFMWAARLAEPADLARHLQEDPDAVEQGLGIMAENVIRLAQACRRAGVDGFYASTQGGEAFRPWGAEVFEKHIKPSDLAVWDVIRLSSFNILHICDYHGGYADLSPFRDYPGQVVNCSLHVGEKTMTPRDAARLFARPFMGGMERTGTIAGGSPAQVQEAARAVLAEAPERFILAADCTVPGGTPWGNLKAAVDAAHEYRRTG